MRVIRNSIFLLLFLSITSVAQENDFQLWNSISLRKKIDKKISLDLKYGLRYRENASLISKDFIDLRTRYKKNKRWSFALGYRNISDWSIASELEKRNRFYIDAYYSKKIKRYYIDIRNRVLAQGNNDVYSEVLRQKIKLSYNLRKTKLEPSISIEFFSSFDNLVNKLRYSLALSHPINKKLDLSFVYKIQQEFNVVDPITLFIFEPKISYKL